MHTDNIQSLVDSTHLHTIHINMTKPHRQQTIKCWQHAAVYNIYKHDKNTQTTYNQRITSQSCIIMDDNINNTLQYTLTDNILLLFIERNWHIGSGLSMIIS